jgi:hypothetical protein
MKKIAVSKISIQSSNPQYSYPIVRLPRILKDLAGKKAQIFQTEYEDSLAFLVVVDKPVDNESIDNSVESRLIAIESKIDYLTDAIFFISTQKNAESQKADTPGQIRTAVAGSKVLHD